MEQDIYSEVYIVSIPDVYSEVYIVLEVRKWSRVYREVYIVLEVRKWKEYRPGCIGKYI